MIGFKVNLFYLWNKNEIGDTHFMNFLLDYERCL